jgi:hypothetical protein
MANRKKTRMQRKMVVSFSVKTIIAEEFRDLCDINKMIPSHEIEKMIQNFNNDYTH